MLTHHPHAPIYWLITELSGGVRPATFGLLWADFIRAMTSMWILCNWTNTRVWCLFYVVMGGFCVQPTVEPSFSRPTVHHGRRCVYFFLEVKGSEGGEKWRGSLKVRAGFLRCSGGHPATLPGSIYIYIYRSLNWYRQKTEKRGETGSPNRQTTTGRD